MLESRCRPSKCSSQWASLAWRLTVTRVQEVARRISNLLSKRTIWKMEGIQKEQLVRPETHPQSCKHKLPPNWESLRSIPRSKRMFSAWTSRFLMSCPSYLPKKWASSHARVARATVMLNDFRCSRQSRWIRTIAVPRDDQEVQRGNILRKWSSLMFLKSSRSSLTSPTTSSLPIQTPILIITKSWELPNNNIKLRPRPHLLLTRMLTIKTRSKRVKPRTIADHCHRPFRAKLWPLATLIKTVLLGRTAHMEERFSWVRIHPRLVRPIPKMQSPTSSELSRW